MKEIMLQSLYMYASFGGLIWLLWLITHGRKNFRSIKEFFLGLLVFGIVWPFGVIGSLGYISKDDEPI
jgi:hypothetical protein